jgi:isopropylmalate/homocitrate/citramalate synthase
MLKSEVQKRKIELEDDSLREGAQSLLGKTLSTDDLFDFVRMVDQLGIDHLICGFPGASEAEFKNTRDLLKKMTKSKLGVVPWVLARLREEDTDQFLDLKEATGHENVGISFLFQSIVKD